jgi:hypothetical protein
MDYLQDQTNQGTYIVIVYIHIQEYTYSIHNAAFDECMVYNTKLLKQIVIPNFCEDSRKLPIIHIVPCST